MTWRNPPKFVNPDKPPAKKIISKLEAKANNLKLYFTGLPCKNGHVDERWVVGGACKTCKENYKQKHRQTDKFKNTGKAYYLNNKAKILATGRLNRYKLSEDEYNTLILNQNNQCAICFKDFKELDKRKIQVDHCHNSSEVRGILCLDCNLGLGRFYDDPIKLQRAIEYLGKYNGME